MNFKVQRVLHIASLAVLIGVGLYFLSTDREEAERARVAQRLEERMATYVELRMADDTQQLYHMVDPVERRAVSLGNFLQVYGTGMLETLSITPRTTVMDYASRAATIEVRTEARLRVDRLPAQYRANLRGVTEDELERDMVHDLEWVWREDDWYYRLDEAATQPRS